ncbi:MAG: hypothetical protein ACE5HS_01060 [bacterium]
MIHFHKLILLVCCLLLQTTQIFAGAWTQKKHHYYVKISLLRFESTSQYLLNGQRQKLVDRGQVLDLAVNYYMEYGIFDDLTFIASLPFKRINFSCAIEDCNKTSSGVGDIYFGLRYRLSEKLWTLSLQSGIKIAPNYETDEKELNSAPPLGDGQNDFELRLQVGRSIFKYRGYLNLDVGYRARSQEPVDEIPFSFELGVDLTQDYLLSAQIYGVKSISETKNQSDFRIVDGRVVNFVGTGAVEDFIKAQVQFIYRINRHLDLSFLFEQVLDGRNTSHASILGGGVALHR